MLRIFGRYAGMCAVYFQIKILANDFEFTGRHTIKLSVKTVDFYSAEASLADCLQGLEGVLINHIPQTPELYGNFFTF